MAHGGHDSTSGYHFLKNFVSAVKSLPANVVKFFFQDKQDGHCIQCGKPVQDSTIQFCSQKCAAIHWENVRDATVHTSKRWICGYPFCTNPCYIESDGTVHNYCGKTHAQEHKALMEAVDLQIMREKRISCLDSSSAHGANQSWSPHPDNGPILFYNRGSPCYEFTNFYAAKIDLDGQIWPTTEHYFQAQKFIGTPFVEIIRSFPSPRDAFEFSRQPAVAQWRRSDWEDVKINIMRKALLAKFSQHSFLRKKLLQTGMRILMEDSPYDSFWGIGRDHQGQNHLGKLLMDIRDEICKIRKGDGDFSSLGDPQVHQSMTTVCVLSGDTTQMDHASQPNSAPLHSHQEVNNGSQIGQNPVPNPSFNASSDSNVNSNALDKNLMNDIAVSPQVQNEVIETIDPTLPAAGNGIMNQQPFEGDKNGPLQLVESGLIASSVTKPEPVVSQESTTDLNHNMGSTLVIMNQWSSSAASNIVKEVIDCAEQREDVAAEEDTKMDIVEENLFSASGMSSNGAASTLNNAAPDLTEIMELCEESSIKQSLDNEDSTPMDYNLYYYIN